MTTIVHVYDKDTQAPIEGATVTCTGHAPRLTDGNGYAAFNLATFTRYELRADADGYVISPQQSIMGSYPAVGFGLEKEEQIIITVMRPTWVSMDPFPVREDFPVGEELNVMGTIRVETEPYANKDIWLVNDDTDETISGPVRTSDTGYYTISWTPPEYKEEGYNVTIGAHDFHDWGTNPNSKWSEMPNGQSLHINVIGAEFEETIRPTALEWTTPNVYHVAFDITNLNPAYTYTIIIGRKGGSYGRTVSSKSVSNVTATSIEANIEKSELDADGYQIWCSVFKTSPGAQTQEAHELYTVPEGAPDMALILPNANGELFADDTIITVNDLSEACTLPDFQIENVGGVRSEAWYKMSERDGDTIHEPKRTSALAPGETSRILGDYVCAEGFGSGGGLPVGDHAILVEIGPEGEAATDSHTSILHVITQEQIEPLTVTTNDTTSGIQEGSIPVSGYVEGTNGVETDVGFEYEEVTYYGVNPTSFTNTNWSGTKMTVAGGFEDTLINLESDTWFCFRAIAENQYGKAHGAKKWSLTLGASTEGFISISLPNGTLLRESEVMLHNSPDLACTSFDFQMANGLDMELTGWYTVSVDGLEGYHGEHDIPPNGLSPMITGSLCAFPGLVSLGAHEVKVEVAQREQHTAAYTHTETLTVTEYGTPTVDTVGVEDITFNSATLVGKLKDVGLSAQVGFEYGLAIGNTKKEWLSGFITGGIYKLPIDGLERKSVYRYKAITRENVDSETYYGEELSFTAAPAVIDAINLGWNLEDAKMDEFMAHFNVSNLSENKHYRISIWSIDEYLLYAREDNITGRTEVEIRAKIPLGVIETYGYLLSCKVEDLDAGLVVVDETFIIPPFDLKLTTNIGGTLTDIPTTIRTETDYPFIIQIDNTGDKDRKAAIIFQFTGVDMGPLYIYPFPHAPPSEVTEGVVIPAGGSIGFEIIIWLPNAAVPTGATSAMYDLHLTLTAFE